jgi:hypothetical protein
MKPFQQHRSLGFLFAIAGSCGTSSLACGDRAAPPPSAAPSDPGSLEPGTPVDTGAGPGTPGADPAAPGTDPRGSETPAATDAPLDSSGGASGMGASEAPTAGAAGAPSVPPLVPVDCPVAEAVPITVAWDSIADQDAAWYATPEALSLAENVLYYRNANGAGPRTST